MLFRLNQGTAKCPLLYEKREQSTPYEDVNSNRLLSTVE